MGCVEASRRNCIREFTEPFKTEATNLVMLQSPELSQSLVIFFMVVVYAGQSKRMCSRDSGIAAQVPERQNPCLLLDQCLANSSVLYLPLACDIAQQFLQPHMDWGQQSQALGGDGGGSDKNV